MVLFFEKGAPTRKVWYYQLDPGRTMGKTTPLNDDLAEFVALQKTFADSPKSWSLDVATVDTTTYDLSVKNPNGGETVAHRSLREILRALADRLTGEFGKGYSLSNLKSMRQFYLLYQNRIGQTLSGQSKTKSQTVSGQLPSEGDQESLGAFQIVQTASGQSSRPFSLSWSHYVFLLGIKNADERSFYEIEATGQNWTLRELKRQFDSGLYERLTLGDLRGKLYHCVR